MPNCAGIQNAFWAMLVDNLALASQGNADAGIVNMLLSKLNDFFYIIQPEVCDCACFPALLHTCSAMHVKPPTLPVVHLPARCQHAFM